MTTTEERLARQRRGLCIDCKTNDTEHMTVCNSYNMRIVACSDYSSGNRDHVSENTAFVLDALNKINKADINRHGEYL